MVAGVRRTIRSLNSYHSRAVIRYPYPKHAVRDQYDFPFDRNTHESVDFLDEFR